MKDHPAVAGIAGASLIAAIWVAALTGPTHRPDEHELDDSWVALATAGPPPPWASQDAILARALQVLDEAQADPQRLVLIAADHTKRSEFEQLASAFTTARHAQVQAERTQDTAASLVARQTIAQTQHAIQQALAPLRASAHQAHSDALATDRATGRELYLTHCAVCHGSDGAGDGEAAAWLPVAPRDLRRARMRLRTTAEGQPPRDADLYATISLGSRGTPMPGFMTVLSSRERWQLVAYLRSLRSPPPAELATPSRSLVAELGQPPRDIVRRAHAPAKLLAGEQDHGSTARQLYARHCSGCHGTHGEVPYAGRNLLRPWMFRRGSSLADIALVISTGEAGAGMPGFFAGAARSHPSSYSNLDATSVWILAQHVGELAGAQPTPRSARQNDPGRDLGSPTQHHTLRARGWRYERLVDGMWVALDSAPITARSGELLHIRFQPLDNGRGTGQGLALTAHERALHIAGARVDHPSNITFRAGLPGHYTFYNPTASAPGHVLARMRGSFIVEALPQGSR